MYPLWCSIWLLFHLAWVIVEIYWWGTEDVTSELWPVYLTNWGYAVLLLYLVMDFFNFSLRQVHHQHTSWFVYIIETWRRFSIKDIRMIQYMYNRHTDDQKLHIYRQSNITDILTIQYYRHTKNPKLQTYRRSNLTDIQTVQYNKHI